MAVASQRFGKRIAYEAVLYRKQKRRRREWERDGGAQAGNSSTRIGYRTPSDGRAGPFRPAVEPAHRLGTATRPARLPRPATTLRQDVVQRAATAADRADRGPHRRAATRHRVRSQPARARRLPGLAAPRPLV